MDAGLCSLFLLLLGYRILIGQQLPCLEVQISLCFHSALELCLGILTTYFLQILKHQQSFRLFRYDFYFMVQCLSSHFSLA